MDDAISEVISGKRRWAAVQSDAIGFWKSLPDDSVDLCFCSPPYENCRTYGLKERLPAGQAWVDWMVAVVTAAAPKVKGLIAVNCEGQTRGYRYSCTPFLLVADLHRAGFNLRKPCVYERDGIPGSGGPDWLKNRWEPIVCVTRKGKLPWSDKTACGHPPKYGPGGPPSHRLPDGSRVNGTKNELRALGLKVGGRQSRTQNGERNYRVYVPPDIANPGNIIDCGSGTHLEFSNHSEAPFPLELAAFFVKSFAPPGGIVADCFAGSGTTIDAAVQHGRRGIGCDIRESQIELIERRMKTITPALFA